MAKNSSMKYLVGFAAVVLIALVFTGNLKIPQGSLSTTSTPNSLNLSTTPVSTNTQATTGGPFLPAGSQLTITPKHTDFLAATALTESTNVVTYLLNKVGNGYSLVTTGSGQVYTVTSSDGSVYIALTAASGQTYALDVNDFKTANPGRIVNMVYTDWQNSGTKMWVVQMNTNGLLSQQQLSGTKPDLTITIPWFNVNGAVTLTAPAAVTGIGTSATDRHNLVKVTATAAKAQIVREIDVAFNSTSTSKWDDSLTTLATPWGTVRLTDATVNKQIGASSTTYYIKFANDQSAAPVVTIPNNGAADRYDDLKVHWTLSSGNVIQITYTYITMAATDSSQTSSSVTQNNSA